MTIRPYIGRPGEASFMGLTKLNPSVAIIKKNIHESVRDRGLREEGCQHPPREKEDCRGAQSLALTEGYPLRLCPIGRKKKSLERSMAWRIGS